MMLVVASFISNIKHLALFHIHISSQLNQTELRLSRVELAVTMTGAQFSPSHC